MQKAMQYIENELFIFYLTNHLNNHEKTAKLLSHLFFIIN